MIQHRPEQDIINAIRAGDTATFRHVFDAWYENLCQYAFTLLKDSDEAEDTVQAMFLKLWEKRTELDIRQGVKGYLFRAVYNQCINQLEHKVVKRKHEEHSLWQASRSVAPDAFAGEVEDKIFAAVQRLPPQCRTIFVMSRYEELRYAEIADKLGLSVNTIQNQVCKALKLLREELKDIIV